MRREADDVLHRERGVVLGVTTDPLVGRVLGMYRLRRQIGRGGMGVVYEAQYGDTGALYALKVLHPTFCRDEVMVERLRREAVVASQLQHPGIVKVVDHGWDQDFGFFVVMELLQGRGLDELLKEDPVLPLSRASGIVNQMSEALALAHANGIVHRDLKPANIFLMENVDEYERIKVLDFGIARIDDPTGEQQPLTQFGQTFGTPEYMPPEQILVQRDRIGPPTDMYALSVLIFRMLAGHLPFKSKTLIGLMNMVMFRSPPPLSAYREEYKDSQIERLLFRCMAKNPENRVADMTSFRDAFRQAVETDPVVRPLLDPDHGELWRNKSYRPLVPASPEEQEVTLQEGERVKVEQGQTFVFGKETFRFDGKMVISDNNVGLAESSSQKASPTQKGFPTLEPRDSNFEKLAQDLLGHDNIPTLIGVDQDAESVGLMLKEAKGLLEQALEPHDATRTVLTGEPQSLKDLIDGPETIVDFSYEEMANLRAEKKRKAKEQKVSKLNQLLFMIAGFLFGCFIILGILWLGQHWKARRQRANLPAKKERKVLGKFELQILSEPSRAVVVIKGRSVGHTPLSIRRLQGNRLYFEVKKKGFYRMRAFWPAKQSRRMQFTLKKKEPTPSPPR